VLFRSHPGVMAGDIIEKAAMDILRTYKGSNPTEVSQSEKIYASTGNVYNPNSVAQGDKITADWYNKA